MKRYNKLFLACLLLVLFVFSLMAVLCFDVKNIGPLDSSVGLATMNQYFQGLFGTNDLMYKISKLLGYGGIFVCACFWALGIFQWIKRRNIFKVDLTIIYLGVLYAITIGFYVFFTKVAVNYRPVLEDGALEASFPSSHTMLAVVAYGSLFLCVKQFIKNIKVATVIQITSLVLALGMIVCRTLSGVHWFSDIVSGLILALSLLLFFDGVAIEK